MVFLVIIPSIPAALGNFVLPTPDTYRPDVATADGATGPYHGVRPWRVSARQGPHHEAHLLITTGWPRSSRRRASKSSGEPARISLA